MEYDNFTEATVLSFEPDLDSKSWSGLLILPDSGLAQIRQLSHAHLLRRSQADLVVAALKLTKPDLRRSPTAIVRSHVVVPLHSVHTAQ
jgi:hypothetical protein